MEYNYLGRSNLSVSKVCLGTMHFGKYADEQESFAIMDKALDMGINFFDTANVYGQVPGLTEEIMGKWFAQGGGRRERVVLATKVYGDTVRSGVVVPNEEKGISAYKVRRHLEASLKRLQTDHVDLYQVHHIDRRVTGEEFWAPFERLIQRGDVTYVGTSNFPGWGLAKFQMMAQQRGQLGIVSEQTMYNLVNRYPELEVIPAAREFGIGLLAYMPLAGGLLTGKRSSQKGSRTSQVEGEYGIHLAENQQFEEFSSLCSEIGESEHVVAIAWTLANPVVSSAIVGVRSLSHLDSLARAAELQLSPDFVGRLNDLFHINRGRSLRSGESPEAYSW